MFRAGPLGSIRIASSMSPTRLLRPLGLASFTSAARVFLCPVFVATPRTCEFHICCARLIVPSVCRDPSDSQVPHLLRASHCAQCLLRPFRHCRASGILRIASSTSYTCADSAQQLLRPSALQVPYLLHASLRPVFVAPLSFASSISVARVSLCPVSVATLGFASASRAPRLI